MIKEFREFIAKGNVLDMAVGIIIGVAFGKIIASFVSDILMPPIGLLLGKMDLSNMFISLSGETFETLAKAQEAGAATINYGIFIKTVIDFLIVGFVVFLIVRQANKMKKPAPPEPTKDCPFCLSAVKPEATRCPFCTSELKA
jgi:large conductance mechanosensitive channel